ncbi:MAG: response regulator [Patescibacteria group bacterium]
MYILLADDDEFFQKFYSKKLAEEGFEVDLAVNGDEALEKVDKRKPDLILLDIIMPKKTGFEVLEILNARQIIPALPVLVFSTLGQEKDVQKALDLGARDYVNKTFFDFDTLLSKIKKLSSGDKTTI